MMVVPTTHTSVLLNTTKWRLLYFFLRVLQPFFFWPSSLLLFSGLPCLLLFILLLPGFYMVPQFLVTAAEIKLQPLTALLTHYNNLTLITRNSYSKNNLWLCTSSEGRCRADWCNLCCTFHFLLGLDSSGTQKLQSNNKIIKTTKNVYMQEGIRLNININININLRYLKVQIALYLVETKWDLPAWDDPLHSKIGVWTEFLPWNTSFPSL